MSVMGGKSFSLEFMMKNVDVIPKDHVTFRTAERHS